MIYSSCMIKESNMFMSGDATIGIFYENKKMNFLTVVKNID